MIALAIMLMALPTAAWPADKKETRQREAQLRTQQAVKQAQAKNAQLEQENTNLTNRLKEQEQRAHEVQNNFDRLSRKHKVLAEDFEKERAKAADLEARLQQTESDLRQNRTKLAEISASQLQIQNHLKTAASEKATLDDRLVVCLGKNEQLYKFGRELVNHVERPEGFSSLLRAEPFTQIKRVELENIVQDYRDDLDKNHMKPISSRWGNPR